MHAPGQFAQNNSPRIFKQLAPSFYPLLSQKWTQDLMSYKLFFILLSTTESEDRDELSDIRHIYNKILDRDWASEHLFVM